MTVIGSVASLESQRSTVTAQLIPSVKQVLCFTDGPLSFNCLII